MLRNKNANSEQPPTVSLKFSEAQIDIIEVDSALEVKIMDVPIQINKLDTLSLKTFGSMKP